MWLISNKKKTSQIICFLKPFSWQPSLQHIDRFRFCFHGGRSNFWFNIFFLSVMIPCQKRKQTFIRIRLVVKIMLFKECSTGNKVFIGYELLLKRDGVLFKLKVSQQYLSASSFTANKFLFLKVPLMLLDILTACLPYAKMSSSQ